jgi:hypothetical protein
MGTRHLFRIFTRPSFAVWDGCSTVRVPARGKKRLYRSSEHDPESDNKIHLLELVGMILMLARRSFLA